jgi:hypothetical protein
MNVAGVRGLGLGVRVRDQEPGIRQRGKPPRHEDTKKSQGFSPLCLGVLVVKKGKPQRHGDTK